MTTEYECMAEKANRIDAAVYELACDKYPPYNLTQMRKRLINIIGSRVATKTVMASLRRVHREVLT